jgi:N-acetylmuramoyl-L-alanine amidase
MEKQKYLTRITYSMLIIVALYCRSGAQSAAVTDSVKIILSDRSAIIPSVHVMGQRLLSLNDIAVVLSLRWFENSILQKAEIHLDGVVLKFTADNPFVVQTNAETQQYVVHQFSHSIILRNNVYFAPADETIALLNALGGGKGALLMDTSYTPSAIPVVPSLTGIDVQERKNGYLLRLHLTAKVSDASRSLQVGDWMYVTLAGTVGDTVKLDTTFSTGMIKRIQPIQTETALQLSLHLRKKISSSEIVYDQTSNDILLTLIPDVPETKREINTDSLRRVQEIERRRRETASSIEKQKNKWKLDVIVLDAGHGGKDPGTIGVIGTREKDITLGVALKLGALIERYMTGVKVVYTRKTDKFIELYRRGQIANEAEGKLFVSIHCNSTERKPSNANGFEIYLLRPGKTEDAIRIAEKENAVVQLEKDYEDRYQNLTEENFIILTMAQSAYVKQSERFAELLEETMSAEMEAQRTPVKQAGFYVLVGASMPNVLIETGYLSNPKEEKFLRSPSGQQKIAEAILKALQRFKIEYEQ